MLVTIKSCAALKDVIDNTLSKKGVKPRVVVLYFHAESFRYTITAHEQLDTFHTELVKSYKSDKILVVDVTVYHCDSTMKEVLKVFPIKSYPTAFVLKADFTISGTFDLEDALGTRKNLEKKYAGMKWPDLEGTVFSQKFFYPLKQKIKTAWNDYNQKMNSNSKAMPDYYVELCSQVRYREDSERSGKLGEKAGNMEEQTPDAPRLVNNTMKVYWRKKVIRVLEDNNIVVVQNNVSTSVRAVR